MRYFLCNFINEESKNLKDEVRENSQHWRDKFSVEKSMKAKEVMKMDSHMDE